jgi:hypothetical protein
MQASQVQEQVGEVSSLAAKRRSMEKVNHPKHYGGDVPHETWKCLHAWGLEADALLWNVVKYISRAGKKVSLLEDLKKAKWYLDKRIELLEAECRNSSTGARNATNTTGCAAAGRRPSPPVRIR